MVQPIGFVDSGVGAMSVLKLALERHLPSAVYLGDNGRMPYGTRPASEVKTLTLECFEEISKYDPAAVVLACNTATAYALEAVQEVFSFPIIGVIDPACRRTCEVTKNQKIALLATQGTVKSGLYPKKIKGCLPDAEVVGVGAPDLVTSIQSGHLDDPEVEEIVRRYLKEFGSFDFDTLILGCTHFPLARPVFDRIFPKESGVSILDPAEPTLDELAHYFSPAEDEKGEIHFMATGNVAEVQEVAERFLDLSGKQVTFEQVEVKKGGS